MNQQNDKLELLFKILVVGEIGSGKTSIIRRYVHNEFNYQYKATIGVDFSFKELDYDKNTHVKLQLWDIAGQERYGNITRVYYKEAVGAFVVFDLTRMETFNVVHKWKRDIDDKVKLQDDSPIPGIKKIFKTNTRFSFLKEIYYLC
eukprot:TRINITY_DN1671_c0_g1_i1.p1 TRINITY_DN1671_c0_g1~~TRINITY_DN1671_c0_g1_i1.p1  ORF type:complete len:146 (-),score=18.92 TRINITY_DN1671_c0_g1_i1:103-540(-)